MSMSMRECGRCGGVVGPDGRCSVCGNVVVAQAPDAVKQDPFTSNPGARRDVRPSRPAFLFNRITNERFPLTQSVSKIGRDQTNNISITNDHYVSRHHAWVLQMQGGYWVEDLGSTNGTLLNGELLNERRQVMPGDRITFGKTELVFVMD